jgi:hypothetical protein
MHSSQLATAEQYGLFMLVAQLASVPHSPQILAIGWQYGLFAPPVAAQSVSVAQVGSQLSFTHIWAAGQWLVSMHSSQFPVGRPAAFGRRSQRLLVVWAAQSVSLLHSMQRLFGRSQTSSVWHVVVPHGVLHEPLTQLMPVGQWLLSRHSSQL